MSKDEKARLEGEALVTIRGMLGAGTAIGAQRAWWLCACVRACDPVMRCVPAFQWHRPSPVVAVTHASRSRGVRAMQARE